LGLIIINTRVERPTHSLVQHYVSLFDNDERYGLADRSLFAVVSVYPTNSILEHVLVKSALLNSFYNTNVFAIDKMARHIYEIDVDSSLSSGDDEVVENIALLTIRGDSRRHYSFATKYCSMHYPELFPIYDSKVDEILRAYRRDFKFASFNNSDLKEYGRFREIIFSFQSFFSLANFTYKEIDKFLWFYGKDLFNSK
jgi:hypothetical protein